MAPKLYSWAESGNCYKVRLLASLLGIRLDIQELNYINDEQHSEWYLKINPRGEIPCLVTEDGLTLTDSGAILTYLAGTCPDRGGGKVPSSYWSDDVKEQAQIVDWLVFAASWVQNGICAARAILFFKEPENDFEKASTTQKLKESQARGHKSLDVLNKRLDEHQWLALGRPTIADVAVFVYVALAPMGDIKLDKYPNVERWIEDVKYMQGFIPILGLDDPMYRRKSNV